MNGVFPCSAANQPTNQPTKEYIWWLNRIKIVLTKQLIVTVLEMEYFSYFFSSQNDELTRRHTYLNVTNYHVHIFIKWRVESRSIIHLDSFPHFITGT
jgi:phosphatidylserine decarboxylase